MTLCIKMATFTEHFFVLIISEIIYMDPDSMESEMWKRTMKSFFGVSLGILFILWNLLSTMNFDEDMQPAHLLMALYFLKVYPKELVACGVFHVSAKTW